jgi:hypothetical protein
MSPALLSAVQPWLPTVALPALAPRPSELAAARGWRLVVLRLTYLGVTNAFALLRLLPRSDRDKDIEILTLRTCLRSPSRDPDRLDTPIGEGSPHGVLRRQ